MKVVHIAARAALTSSAALAALSPAVARGDDTVRACIAASTNGQLLRKQGKLLASRDELIACSRDACPAIVRSHCARWLSEVEAAIPSIVVRAEDASGDDALGARVTVDDRPGKLDGQPVRLDPGAHAVVITNDRGGRKEEHVLLVEGDASRRVTLRFPADATAAAHTPTPAVARSSSEPRARTLRIPAGVWILGGAGVLALGAATYFGLAANAQLNGLQSCTPHCLDSQTQTGRTDALLFYVSFGVGGAAVVGALVWALAFPTHAAPTPSARVDLVPLGGSAGAGGIAGAMTALTVSY